MSAEQVGNRNAIATVVATAAVTLALGVTAAALGGYIVPNPGGEPMTEQAIARATAEAAPTPKPVGASVVLVPIAPDSLRGPPAATPVQSELEALVRAANEQNECGDDDEHTGRRGHRHRDYEDARGDDD